jgi:hypothetical protein
MKGLLEFLWGCALIGGFFFICTHIGFVPAIVFGMFVGMFLAAAHEHH